MNLNYFVLIMFLLTSLIFSVRSLPIQMISLYTFENPQKKKSFKILVNFTQRQQMEMSYYVCTDICIMVRNITSKVFPSWLSNFEPHVTQMGIILSFEAKAYVVVQKFSVCSGSGSLQ